MSLNLYLKRTKISKQNKPSKILKPSNTVKGKEGKSEYCNLFQTTTEETLKVLEKKSLNEQLLCYQEIITPYFSDEEVVIDKFLEQKNSKILETNKPFMIVSLAKDQIKEYMDTIYKWIKDSEEQGMSVEMVCN